MPFAVLLHISVEFGLVSAAAARAVRVGKDNVLKLLWQVQETKGPPSGAAWVHFGLQMFRHGESALMLCRK